MSTNNNHISGEENNLLSPKAGSNQTAAPDPTHIELTALLPQTAPVGQDQEQTVVAQNPVPVVLQEGQGQGQPPQNNGNHLNLRNFLKVLALLGLGGAGIYAATRDNKKKWNNSPDLYGNGTNFNGTNPLFNNSTSGKQDRRYVVIPNENIVHFLSCNQKLLKEHRKFFASIRKKYPKMTDLVLDKIFGREDEEYGKKYHIGPDSVLKLMLQDCMRGKKDKTPLSSNPEHDKILKDKCLAGNRQAEYEMAECQDTHTAVFFDGKATKEERINGMMAAIIKHYSRYVGKNIDGHTTFPVIDFKPLKEQYEEISQEAVNNKTIDKAEAQEIMSFFDIMSGFYEKIMQNQTIEDVNNHFAYVIAEREKYGHKVSSSFNLTKDEKKRILASQETTTKKAAKEEAEKAKQAKLAQRAEDPFKAAKKAEKSANQAQYKGIKYMQNLANLAKGGMGKG